MEIIQVMCPHKMSNYQRGKIYKLTSPNTDNIYIGSTIQTLEKRLIIHKHETKHNKGNSSSVMFRYGVPQIELIENYPCNSKKELVAREQYYMDLYSELCINLRNAIDKVGSIEYCRRYRNSEKGKKWREDNREHIIEYRRKKHQTTEYKEQEKERRETPEYKIMKSKCDKNYREKNREKVLANKKIYYDWINSMGGDYRYNNNITRIDPTLFS